jgi:hypothetical protein
MWFMAGKRHHTPPRFVNALQVLFYFRILEIERPSIPLSGFTPVSADLPASLSLSVYHHKDTAFSTWH